MSPLPDVRQMARKPARNDEDRIYPDVVARLHKSRRDALRSSDHTPEPPCIERDGGRIMGSASLYLDERERSPSARHDVDLSAGHTGPPSKDSPAVKPQPPAGERLGPTAPLLSFLAVHFERSRAMV